MLSTSCGSMAGNCGTGRYSSESRYFGSCSRSAPSRFSMWITFRGEHQKVGGRYRKLFRINIRFQLRWQAEVAEPQCFPSGWDAWVSNQFIRINELRPHPRVFGALHIREMKTAHSSGFQDPGAFLWSNLP